jgi:hypothetical protein
MNAARQVSWLPGVQLFRAACLLHLPRSTKRVDFGASYPATVAGPRRRLTGFPLGPLPGAPRRRTTNVRAAYRFAGAAVKGCRVLSP